VTRHSAYLRAARHWTHLGITFVTVRRKSVVDRFEVGYWNKKRVVLGAGLSWEDAFDQAIAAADPRGDQRPSHGEAQGAIRTFLRREGIRFFELVEDGTNAWAFWPTFQPHTTSYYHADGSIEWYGQGR
jgi:hypothetical protein